MSVRVRFAPSPTGPLHIGGVRTALYNYLFAKNQGGEMILRVEDTDQARYVPGAEAYIVEALQWLGIAFDHGPHIRNDDPAMGPFRQSERKPMYRQYAEQLIAADWAYYAFDTAEELDEMRAQAEKAGMKNWQYNAITRERMQNAVTLPADEVQKRLESGADYVVRMKIPRGEEIRFHDTVRGWVNVSSNVLDDKVLLKSDGMPTYHLANIVDDHLMQITHVIRGEEWLPSMPLHVLLYQAFGWELPQFAHLPLLLKPDGNGKLSKRDGDKLGFPVFPLEWKNPETGEVSSGYREAGYLPEAVVNFLALLGWSPGGDEELMDMPRLIELFSLERVGKSGVKFDFQKAQFFQQTYLRKRPAADFLPHLRADIEAASLPVPEDAFLLRTIELLFERAVYPQDFFTQGRYFFQAPTTKADYDEKAVEKRWNPDASRAIAAIADAYASLKNWDGETLEATFKTTAESLELQPGKVMPALRLAATGAPAGPGMWDTLALLGKEDTVQRLRTAVSVLG